MNQQRAATAAKLLSDTLFNPELPPPEDQCIFRMHFKRILNLGDYMLFTGKKGTGKTKIVAAAVASALTREPIFNFVIKLPDHKRKVMHLDTEQGRTSHYRMMDLIVKLAGIGEVKDLPLHFSTHRCRGIRPQLIRDMIEYYLHVNTDCGLVVLDGMLDTVDNMNDVTESKRLKEWMEGTSEKYNVGIAGVMHRGFSADKAIGHSGSFLERGAQTVLKIEKDKREGQEFYLISTEHIREDAPPPDTAFFYNKNSNAWELFDIAPAETAMPDQPGNWKKLAKNSPNAYDIQDHSRRCAQIFDCGSEFLPYDKLISEIQMAYACSQRQARTDFYQYLLNQFFWKTENGYTNKKQAKLFITK